jgi:hypothetical protein
MNNEKQVDKKRQIIKILNDFYQLVIKNLPKNDQLLTHWVKFKQMLESACSATEDYQKLHNYVSKMQIQDLDEAYTTTDNITTDQLQQQQQPSIVVQTQPTHFKKSYSEKVIKGINPSITSNPNNNQQPNSATLPMNVGNSAKLRQGSATSKMTSAYDSNDSRSSSYIGNSQTTTIASSTGGNNTNGRMSSDYNLSNNEQLSKAEDSSYGSIKHSDNSNSGEHTTTNANHNNTNSQNPVENGNTTDNSFNQNNFSMEKAAKSGKTTSVVTQPPSHQKSVTANNIPQVNINLMTQNSGAAAVGATAVAVAAEKSEKAEKRINLSPHKKSLQTHNTKSTSQLPQTQQPVINIKANNVFKLIPSLDYVSKALNKPYFTISNYNVYTNIQVVEMVNKENTFYIAILLHFFYNLLHDKCHHHTLSHLYEKLQSKKIKLIFHPQEEKLVQCLLTNMKFFITEKIKRGPSKGLYESFLEKLFKDSLFQDALIAFMKELLIEFICSLDAKTFSMIFPNEQKSMNRLFSNIRSNTIDPSEELVSLVPNIIESNLEIHYMKENKIEIVLYNQKPDHHSKEKNSKEHPPVTLICTRGNHRNVFQIALNKDDIPSFVKVANGLPSPTVTASSQNEIKAVPKIPSNQEIDASNKAPTTTSPVAPRETPTKQSGVSSQQITQNITQATPTATPSQVNNTATAPQQLNTSLHTEAIKKQERETHNSNSMQRVTTGSNNSVHSSTNTSFNKISDVPPTPVSTSTPITVQTTSQNNNNFLTVPGQQPVQQIQTPTQQHSHPAFTKAHSLPISALNPQMNFNKAQFTHKAKEMLTFFDRHTKNLLQYFPENHLNVEPPRPSYYLPATPEIASLIMPPVYQTPSNATAYLPQSVKGEKTRITTTYNIIQDPPKLNYTYSLENKENTTTNYTTMPTMTTTTTTTTKQLDPMAAYQNYNFTMAASTPTNMSSNPYTQTITSNNTMPSMTTTTTTIPYSSYSLSSQQPTQIIQHTPLHYDMTNKYANVGAPASPSRNNNNATWGGGDNRKYTLQVPTSYEYPQPNIRSPLKKIVVYSHQPKMSSFAQIDREADYMLKKAPLSPSTNRIIYDDDHNNLMSK